MHRLIYVLIICIIFFLAVEVLIRINLFSDNFKIERLRNPSCYGGYSADDDYWKLYYKLDGEFKPPSSDRIHPVLGWSQTYVNDENPLGLEKENLELMDSNKRKILFYGDSYVKGVSDSEHEIPKYMTSHFNNTAVIDLGCGGYGLDQMFLMFKMTHKKVSNPFIVFGVLVDDDLDRSILSVRTGQKPYFVIKDRELVLEGVPIDLDPEHYFNTNSPNIISYLFRLVSRGFLNRFSYLGQLYLSKIDKKIEINTRIIEEIYSICKKENNPLIFVLFYSNYTFECKLWQEEFLKHKLEELDIPYIDTKYFLIQYARKQKKSLLDFYVVKGQGRGHHNNLGNKVISDVLLNYFSQVYNLN